MLTGLVFFGWGEIFSLFPSTLTDTFGPKYATTNYGFLYIAQGVGSILGGPAAAFLKQTTGSWTSVFIVVAILDAVTALLAITALRAMRRKHFATGLSSESPPSSLTLRQFPPRNRPLRGPKRPARCFAPAVCAGAKIRRQNLSVPAPTPQEGRNRGGRDPQPDRITARTRMTKRHQAKYKIDRRMGENIWGRPKSPINKREYGPGQHGQRRKGKVSDYGVQLRAKQKLKGYYANMNERHFRGIYDEARRLKGDTGATMIALLERRLDTVIYRAKFVPTVFAARQFVSHGHINVNGKRVTIASYRVKVDDLVEVKEKSKQLALVLEATALAERDVPDYIDVDHTRCRLRWRAFRRSATCPYPVQMEPHLVVEFTADRRGIGNRASRMPIVAATSRKPISATRHGRICDVS